MTALTFTVERPAAQPIDRTSGTFSAMCCEQSGSSAVNEQRAQTHIALFGDLSQSTLFGTGALVGSEAQPGSEMTARGEALDIADDGASKRIKQLRWGREPRAARWFNRRASTVSLFKYLLNGKRDYTGLFPNNAPHSSPARVIGNQAASFS